MNAAAVDALKRMNLVEFLAEHYGVEFRRRGAQYVALSPFQEETRPSFFVRQRQEHWLFKDFSSGHGGTIFDFVRIKEQLSGFREAWNFLVKLLEGSVWTQASCVDPAGEKAAGPEEKAEPPVYDVKELYRRMKDNDVEVCRRYLIEERSIEPELVDQLTEREVLLHNRYRGRSYCCFAVHDEKGVLWCLDNHQIDGSEKFVLGRKTIFSLELEALSQAPMVFLCEGIIDYLSVKTLDEEAPPGFALLGAGLDFDPRWVAGAHTIVSALDQDRAGQSGFLDLLDLFPEKKIDLFDLGDAKDPNDLLLSEKQPKRPPLSVKQKMQLYREFMRSDNKSDLARHWGIDRTYLYEIVRSCNRFLEEGLMERRVGRPSQQKPPSLQEAWDELSQLRDKYEAVATEKEKLYCEREFLKLHLKFAREEVEEAAEQQGKRMGSRAGVTRKRHQKKRTRKRSSR